MYVLSEMMDSCHTVSLSPKSHRGGGLICSAGPVVTAPQGDFGDAPTPRGRLGGCCGSVGAVLRPPSVRGAVPAVGDPLVTSVQRLRN